LELLNVKISKTMKKLFLFSLILLAANSCQKTKTSFSTIQEYLISEETAKQASDFPLHFITQSSLPVFAPLNANEAYVFQSVNNTTAYLVNTELFSVKRYNLESGQMEAILQFDALNQFIEPQKAACFILDDDRFVWYGDSTTIYVCNSAGQVVQSSQLPLSHQERNFAIAPTANAKIQFHKQSATLVFPIRCTDDYDASIEHSLPQFVAFNLSTGATEFISITLPTEYPADRYIPVLYDPLTALYGDVFYALFPLCNKLFSYNLNTKELNITALQLPVSLTSPSSVQQALDIAQINEFTFKSNRIKGFSVLNGKVLVQQIDGYDENLESLNYIDNTALFAFNPNGSLIWGGRFTPEPFKKSLFDIVHSDGKSVYFLHYDKPTVNSNRILSRFELNI
jgi:hypothetical protein